MTNNFKALIILIIVSGISVFVFRDLIFSNDISEPELVDNEIAEDSIVYSEEMDIENVAISEAEVPLARISERISKKKFGDFITPQNSPVQPERFSGYHTGLDLETFEDEKDMDIPIKAICDGSLAVKRTASGYGGLIVEKCILDGESVTVIYGHLDIDNIILNVGDSISIGDFLGNLGKGSSSETDYERKHLHLGIHKGSSINISGYVQGKSELSNWIDPCLHMGCYK